MTNFGMPGSELIAHQIGEWADKLIDRQIERNAWLDPRINEKQKAGGQPNKRAGHNHE